MPPGPALRAPVLTGALLGAAPSALRLVVWVDAFSTVFTGAGGPASASSTSLPRIPACQRNCCRGEGARTVRFGCSWGMLGQPTEEVEEILEGKPSQLSIPDPSMNCGKIF